MRVTVGVMIGKNEKRWASKTIDLDFAPTPGMKFQDGTWKDADGREITGVNISCLPGDDPSLSITLQTDKETPVPTYEAHEWTIS